MRRNNLSGISVLIVECNPLLRTLFRQVLREFNVGHVTVVGNERDGFNTFELTNPDLVILDWCPNCDGLALLNRIRNDPDSANPYVPIIIASAYAEADAVARARDNGMSEFLAKPISALALYDRITAVMSNQRAFIKAETFFGPDRRRHAQEALLGGKRGTDSIAA